MKSSTIVAAAILLITAIAYAEASGGTKSAWFPENLWRGALIGGIIGYFAGRKWKSR